MNVQNYVFNRKEFVIVIGRTQIIYHSWEGFQIDIDYIENNFNCYFYISEAVKYPIFYTKTEAERFMEYLRPLIEPHLVMIKLLGG